MQLSICCSSRASAARVAAVHCPYRLHMHVEIMRGSGHCCSQYVEAVEAASGRCPSPSPSPQRAVWPEYPRRSCAHRSGAHCSSGVVSRRARSPAATACTETTAAALRLAACPTSTSPGVGLPKHLLLSASSKLSRRRRPAAGRSDSLLAAGAACRDGVERQYCGFALPHVPKPLRADWLPF